MAWTTAASGQPITADLWNADVRNQVIARVTSSTRPSAATAGQYIYETDTQRVYVYNGTTWILSGGNAAWVTYTPTLTASTTNPTLGTGSTATGRYSRDGRTVNAQVDIVFGSSGVSIGSGTYRISLPFTAGATAQPVTGVAYVRDASASTQAMCWVTIGAGATFATLQYNSDTFTTSSVTNAAPWTFAASDEFHLSFTYETA